MSRPNLLAEHPAVERCCSKLESKRPLDMEGVERAIGRIRRPDVVRDRLGESLLYAQRVEAEVAEMHTEDALPHAPGDHLERFLRVWTPDEVGHGRAQHLLLDALGLEVEPAATEDGLPAAVAGGLGRMSERCREVVFMAYHTVGAMNERLALSAYQSMAATAGEIGEPQLAEALFDPMRRDESMHLGYYRTYARELARRLRPWQRTLTRALVVKTYAPVGARLQKHKAPLGRTLRALGEDADDPQIASQIQAIAQELLADGGPDLPPFVRRAMQRCADAARDDERSSVEAPDVVAAA